MRLKFYLLPFAVFFLLSPSTALTEKTSVWKGPELSEEEEKGKTSEEIKTRPAPRIAPGMPAAEKIGKEKIDELVVTYVMPKDKRYAELASTIKESKGIDEIVEAVNDAYDFPHIDVVFDLCGEDNAFYDSKTRRIILCYELVASLADSFRKDKELTDDEVGTQVIASLIFTFFHELGHAAIDVFDLPITGNEEDAVDRFATLLLLLDNEGEDTLADAAIGSFDLDTAESLEDLDFADEHPVNEQRWYTMACLMVGSDPEKYDYLIGEDGLPEARAEACPYEFEKMSKSWEALMKDHLKAS